MIKSLPHYLIPQVFTQSATSMRGMRPGNVYPDLIEWINDHPEVDNAIGDSDLDFAGVEEQDDPWLIDMGFSVQYNNSLGTLYVTWSEEENWEYTSLWYIGRTEDDDEVTDSWNPQ